MKKYILLISILVFCVCMPCVANAETTLTVENVSASVGETITVNVNLSDNTDVAGGGFVIKYNPDILEVSGGTVGSGLMGLVNTAHSENKVKVGVASFSTLPQNMVFCSLTFRVKANGLCELTVEEEDFRDIAGKLVKVSATDGKVLVTNGEGGVIYGDVYCDYTIDIKDAQRLYMYIVGSVTDLTEYELSAADVYKDGSITVKDAQKMAQYLAGYSDIVLGE